jgi:hypothetical protein
MKWPFQGTATDTPDAAFPTVLAALEQVIGKNSMATHAPIQPETFLGADLGLTSIAVARLAGLLNQRGGGKPLPFHTLLVKPDGSLLQDIRISDLVAFLQHHGYGGTP